MANYALGALVNGQTIVTKKYNAPEQRRQMPTVMDLALKNQTISIPDAQALRVSPLRTVDVIYNKNIAAGSATAKAYNHTGTIGDSGKINVTYQQTVETFSLPRKIAYNNIEKYTQMFANQYEMAWKNLKTRQDVLALAYLYANRVQLSQATMAARLASAFGAGATNWNDTNYALELSSGDQSLFIANVKAALYASYYNTEYDIIADVQKSLQIENYMNQGTGNYSNTSWQFAGCNFARTQMNIDSNYTAGTVLAMPAGAFAGLCWNEGLNVKGDFGDEGGSIGILTTANDPFGGQAIADISMYSQRADTSADTTGGSPEDIVDQWELTLTMGYVIPPLSTAGDSTVMEISQIAGVS
ncbi:MAG: hypothetical protein K0Q79_2749 [Flavipsychrobacter sp.]|jgi:hypothetical protein|nr:hypothetical protein [Flavipsychrobacter sp.]